MVGGLRVEEGEVLRSVVALAAAAAGRGAKAGVSTDLGRGGSWRVGGEVGKIGSSFQGGGGKVSEIESLARVLRDKEGMETLEGEFPSTMRRFRNILRVKGGGGRSPVLEAVLEGVAKVRPLPSLT